MDDSGQKTSVNVADGSATQSGKEIPRDLGEAGGGSSGGVQVITGIGGGGSKGCGDDGDENL